ncbi:MAG: hypothetical protein HBSIN02_06610 [Bacteroidia bacterium]|nr:MAG: hypothetical protein HBSIN02_06610 [Bacteroidia bacterium]
MAESERECGCFGGLIESPQLWDLNSAMTSIIAVSLSEQAKLGDFLKRVPVSLPIALPSDMEEFKRQNNLSFVPLTFLVDQRFFPSAVLTLEY